jgi:RNA polymerase sigma-70 factor (ECF subfamily)
MALSGAHRSLERSIALTVTDPAEPVRDRGAIAEAIRTLSPRAWLRLHKTAAFYARLLLDMEPEDLLQEAFRRALDGERNCPLDVDVVRFLCESVRGIAGDERRKARRRPAWAPLAGHSDEAALGPDPPDPLPSPEQQFADKEDALRRRAEILAVFADDLVAQTIVEGILENIRGEELRALTGLDETGYESKRRLIRRRLEKRKGVKP